jgi:diguanylate cyclase (GGDEF)-like protein
MVDERGKAPAVGAEGADGRVVEDRDGHVDVPSAGVAPLPANETARLRTLQEFRILDTGRDARFEELAAEVASICSTPIATITFVDATRQWFKASIGIPFEQTARDIAFCSHTILDPDNTLVIEDTTQDPRFANNPLVLGDPHLMAYAGAPMVAPDGTVIGTVCAMDYEPRTYTPQQIRTLQRVAAQVVELLDATSAADRLLVGATGTPDEASVDTDPAVAAGTAATDDGWNGREGSSDEVLALTRPLIEAIGEDVEITEVLERFCAEVIDTFGWWAARIAWVQGDTLRPDAWQVAPGAPPVLAQLASVVPGPVDLDDLSIQYRDPAVHDVGMLRWFDDRDVVAGIGGRHVVALDVPGANSLAARLVFLLPSTRALSVGAVRTLTTAAAVLPRVFVQDRARRELTYRATHDMLTGLLNREGLARRYHDVVGDRAVDRAALYIDLDGFKEVNDRLGHRAGDEVLTHVARQISGRIRPTDTAARLGGDEFIVVLDGILHEDEALRVARRLLRALCGTYTIFNTERAPIAVSIGVAMWSVGSTLDDVIHAADGLMYAAKELGGSAIGVDGVEGRRLLGADDGDERDLDVVLSGAIQVAVTQVRDDTGRLRGVRAALSAEVRHPAVDDMLELLLRGVRPLLHEAPEDDPVELLIAPAGVLWGTDGLVLRLLVTLAAALPGVPLRLLLSAEDGHELAVGQALLIRDALGVGLVVGGFGSLSGDLGLVDRVSPVALELAADVLARGAGATPSSAQVAAQALAKSRGLTLLIPDDDRPELETVLSELLTAGELAVLLVDLTSLVVHRREPPPRAGSAAATVDRTADRTADRTIGPAGGQS